MLLPGDRVELVACSDGLDEQHLGHVAALTAALEAIGLQVTSQYPIDRAYGESLRPSTAHPWPDPLRAAHLMDVLEDTEIAAVLDVSGGQLATGVLTHLLPERLSRATGLFMGFSNLTAVCNALYSSGGVPSLLGNPRLLGTSEQIRAAFTTACVSLPGEPRNSDLAVPGSAYIAPSVEFVRGEAMAGPVVGGNLSALLTLAGTPWFPPVAGTIIALEALNPTYSSVAVGLHQLRQMGVFSQASGVLLGQFTSIEKEHGTGAVPALAAELIPDLPLATTRHFGHSRDSRALVIGKETSFEI